MKATKTHIKVTLTLTPDDIDRVTAALAREASSLADGAMLADYEGRNPQFYFETIFALMSARKQLLAAIDGVDYFDHFIEGPPARDTEEK